MKRGSSTIIGNTVNVNTSGSQDVYAFNCETTLWSTLPQCRYIESTLTNIKSKLTAVGGYDRDPYTFVNKLITHHDQRWVELYPPMPTERFKAAVLSTTTHVFVMGGRHMGVILNTTEVLNIRAKQWSTANPIPYEMSMASITLCGEILYLMGGVTS